MDVLPHHMISSFALILLFNVLASINRLIKSILRITLEKSNKFIQLAAAYLKWLLINNLCNQTLADSVIRSTSHQPRRNYLRNRRFQYLYNSNSVESDSSLEQENKINYLNYYFLNNYHHSIVYYNNLILALVVLFILFSVLVLLEEDESYYNLSAISFILLITFNLMLLIFSHNLAKQFLIDQNFYYGTQFYSNSHNYRYHLI